MGGRGRGRGSNLSLTHDQLQALGSGRGENVQILTPPPLFPKLETKPLPLNCDAATDYLLIVKDQFIEFLHESPAYVKANTRTDGIERYSDKYKIALDAKKGKVLNCVWANMPTELKPQARRVHTTTRKRKLDEPNIVKRLQTLEKKESLEGTAEDVETIEDEENAKNPDDNDEDLEDEQEQDEEVDDGTDYANNYFDNGEDYDEEDDNLDDGPVY
ncbi:DNA-directed RNA polymerase III subunit RPC7-like [Epargyreus clarus]|uniref:DNA-directed RNA polymerase III subunit RPC7-like n=1 Tax=Epargyreus clarus TaxID=520877 RepID=UPI003C2AC87B